MFGQAMQDLSGIDPVLARFPFPFAVTSFTLQRWRSIRQCKVPTEMPDSPTSLEVLEVSLHKWR